MMEKAGYIQRTGSRALDGEGNLHEVIEFYVLGARYAVRRPDLAKAISGRVFVQIEEITRNWNYYLGATRGLAQVSASGRALNIEIFGRGNFTVSLSALRQMMYGKERYGVIVRIPEHPVLKIRRITEGQQRISATG
jgi:hypothetical protein